MEKPTPSSQDGSQLPTITVIGSLNVDLVTVTPRVPNGGETLIAESFSIGWGGKGANQAVAAARLSRQKNTSHKDTTTAAAATTTSRTTSNEPSGAVAGAQALAQVRMIGAVGEDQFGPPLLKSLEADGIDVDRVRVMPDRTTGTAVILVEKDSGENRILVTPGANAALTAQEDLVGEVGFGEITIFQLETPIDTVLENIARAKSSGAQVIFNPAPADQAASMPSSIYENVAHLIMNEGEAKYLFSKLSGHHEDTDDMETIAKEFISKGVNIVIVTLGGDGVYYLTASRCQKGHSGVLLPAQKVNVVDTTGAGDTFVGAYAVRMALHVRDMSADDSDRYVDEAIKFGIAASARTVQKEGAQSSIPWLGEV